MTRKIICSLLISWLCACASSEKTQYYQLPDSAFRAPHAAITNERAVKLVLASHLSGEPLLYQTDEFHLNFAQKNLWAMPLTDALEASFSNKLNQLSSRYAHIPQRFAHKNHTVLTIYLDRFQGTYKGETEISGYAQWGDGKRIPFQVHTPQHGDGYAAMVDSLDKGLNTVARLIID